MVAGALLHSVHLCDLKDVVLAVGSTDGGSFEAQVEPYKSDNAKLVKENNDLHQQMIRLKEELDITSKGTD